MTTIALPQPYLLFLGDTTEPGYAKTAFGLRDWAPERCIGEFSVPGATVTTGLPSADTRAGRQRRRESDGDRRCQRRRIHSACVARCAGRSDGSGARPDRRHACARLRDFPRLRETAERLGRRLIDIRIPPERIPVATGKARTGRRLLTIGTDCALGKKYTALSLARAFQSRGVDATFRATGQTGILIAGGGIPMDAVVADFAAGAAELLTPDAAPLHWDVMEGEGSLHHPAYAGVSLALLHGSQPDVIVVCHEPGRDRVLGHPDYPVPGLRETIELALRLGARTSPRIRCAGISLNTGKLDANEAARVIASESEASRIAGRRSDSWRRCVRAPRGILPGMSAPASSSRSNAGSCRGWRSRPPSSAAVTRRGANSRSTSSRVARRAAVMAILVAMFAWSALCALTFAIAHATRSYDYRSFFATLLGPFAIVFELAYLVFMVLILAVFGAAAGAIGQAVFGWPTLVGTLVLMLAIGAFTAFGNHSVERLFKYVAFPAVRRVRVALRVRADAVRQSGHAAVRDARADRWLAFGRLDVRRLQHRRRGDGPAAGAPLPHQARSPSSRACSQARWRCCRACCSSCA